VFVYVMNIICEGAMGTEWKCLYIPLGVLRCAHGDWGMPKSV